MSGLVSWNGKSKAGSLEFNVVGQIEFDGFMSYKVEVTAGKKRI